MIVKDRDIKIMGIVNLTDNSYFAESRCLERGKIEQKRLLTRIETLLNEGADIIDCGACSTRPMSEAVGEQREWEILQDALTIIRKEFPDITLSIDSYFPSVVDKVYNLIGDFIVNDVSAGNGMDPKLISEPKFDSGMLELVAKLKLRYVAMHLRGTPKNMLELTDYKNDSNSPNSPVTSEVIRYFKAFEQKANTLGIEDWIIDPGFGFAKTIEQNYELLKELEALKQFNKQILIGVSRKSMIFRKFDITAEEALPATQVLHFSALQSGANILRVHDVAEAKQCIEIYKELN